MNTDLSRILPNETLIEYYKRCRIVLEDENKRLRKMHEITADEMSSKIRDALVAEYAVGSHLGRDDTYEFRDADQDEIKAVVLRVLNSALANR